MKMLLSIIAMMGLAGAAQAAEVITLSPTGAGLTRSFSETTPSGDVVAVNASYGNHTVATINGVVYDSLGQLYLGDYVNVPLYAADGSYLLITMHFTSYITRQSSGRGGGRNTVHYNLVSGSVAL